jgi:mono/diheme cytochrome c family protein
VSDLWNGGWLNALIGLLQTAQLALLQLLAWLGLAELQHGQPAWPWALRLSGENLLIDLGQARRLAGSLAVLALVLALILVALLWRRWRWRLLLAGALLLLVAPWPDRRVLAVAATPASFHRAPAGPSVASIAQGQQLYAQQCLACHGSDGRGQGPLAAVQAVSPPNLAGPLLWRRADGDLLWHVLHGVQGRSGVSTMQAFGDRLGDADAWALIDFMKALVAGESLRSTGAWALPVRLPDAQVRCAAAPPHRLSDWRGQRLRLVVDAGQPSTPPLEDPRLVTVLLRPPGAPQPEAGCAVDASDAAAAWAALALLTGTPSAAGTTLIADRDGWLRARSTPGQAGWSDADLLCRTEVRPQAGSALVASADGLGALISRMDAEPVRFVKGGFVH